MRLTPCVIIAALLVLPATLLAQPPASAGAQVGQAAPTFSLRDLRGHLVGLPDLTKNSRTVVLHFWNTG